MKTRSTKVFVAIATLALGACGSGSSGADTGDLNGSITAESTGPSRSTAEELIHPAVDEIDDQALEDLVGPAAATLAQLVNRAEPGDLDDCPITSVAALIATAPPSVAMSDVELVQSRVDLVSAQPPFDAVRCRFDTSLGKLDIGAFRTIAEAQTSIFCMGMRSGNMTGYLDPTGPLYTFYLEGGENQCGSFEPERAGIIWEFGNGLVVVLTPPFGTNGGDSAELLEDWIDKLGRDAVQRLANGGAAPYDEAGPAVTYPTLVLATTGYDSPTGDFDNPQAAAERIVGDDATRTFEYVGLTITTNHFYRGVTIIEDGEATHVFPGIALTNGLLLALEDNGDATSGLRIVIRKLSDLAAEPTIFESGVPSTSISSETTLLPLGDTAFVMIYFTDRYPQGDGAAKEALAAWKVFSIDFDLLAEGSGYVSVSSSTLLKCCDDADRSVIFSAP